MNKNLLILSSLGTILLYGCSTCAKSPDKSLVKSPQTVYNFFKESLKCKNYDDAYQVLSPDTKEEVKYEEFYLAFTNFFVLARIIYSAKAEVSVDEENKTGKISLTNDEFGLSKKFKIKYFGIGNQTGYWVIELPRSEIEELLELAKKWYKFQLANLGERKYSIPYWWQYKKFNLEGKQ